MRKQFPIDRYTGVILLLIPAILLSAWVISRQSDTKIGRQRCLQLTEYLAEVQEINPLYENAGGIGEATEWTERLSAIKPPYLAGRTQQLVLEMSKYISEHGIEADTHEPGGMLGAMPGFASEVNLSREKMIKACPEIEGTLPNAFPMLWGKE